MGPMLLLRSTKSVKNAQATKCKKKMEPQTKELFTMQGKISDMLEFQRQTSIIWLIVDCFRQSGVVTSLKRNVMT